MSFNHKPRELFKQWLAALRAFADRIIGVGSFSLKMSRHQVGFWIRDFGFQISD
jgi:hypothetical protein